MKDLSLWIGDYVDSLGGRGLTPRSTKIEGILLGVFHREFWGDQDLREFQESDFYGYTQWLGTRVGQRGKTLTPRSVHRYAGAVKRFLDWMYRRGVFLENPVESVELLPPAKAERKIPSRDEMTKVLEAITNQRERAMFELIYSSGLRIEEALNLELPDVRLDERLLLIREGKGKKDRFVPFCQMARMHLTRYLQGDRAKVARSLGDEARRPVFLYAQGRLSWKMAWVRWKRALAEVDLEDKGYSIHSIRHATATHLLEAGASVRYVQELLGHESLSTTQRYTRPTQDRVRAIYRSFHPRENELFLEIDEEYLRELDLLKVLLQTNRATRQRRH